jgi:hypothetical protein
VKPLKDLVSATLLALFALVVIWLSWNLDIPDRFSTAPGLLPFVTALALLGMSAVLARQAVRAGAGRQFFATLADGLKAFGANDEDRRALLLIVIVVVYVLLVAAVEFELRLSTPVIELAFSSYEFISIAVITGILKLFWGAALWRCFVVAALGVECLAWAFRYGFNIVMPATF